MVGDGVIAPRFKIAWDVSSLAASFGVLQDDVRAYLTDGRRASFMIERRLRKSNPGWALAPSEGAGWDLKDPQGQKWEVRSITNNGVYFNPSNQVGSGRTFNEAGFAAKLVGLKGYILTDLCTFPVVDCYQVNIDLIQKWIADKKLGINARVGRNTFLTRLAPDIR